MVVGWPGWGLAPLSTGLVTAVVLPETGVVPGGIARGLRGRLPITTPEGLGLSGVGTLARVSEIRSPQADEARHEEE
jgi:hypothetical protein